VRLTVVDSLRRSSGSAARGAGEGTTAPLGSGALVPTGGAGTSKHTRGLGSSGGEKDRPKALLAVVKRVLAAREAAHEEYTKNEVRFIGLFERVDWSVTTTYPFLIRLTNLNNIEFGKI